MSDTSISASTTMRDELFNHFRHRLVHNPMLDRTMVSFQASKQAPFYGWFKYREGFSQQLVQYLLQTLMPQPGILLDPFAGAGSALFAASEMGWMAQGIEVLPVGIYAIKARIAAEHVDIKQLNREVKQALSLDFHDYYQEQYALKHIAITRAAFPEEEEQSLIGYIAYCNEHVADDQIRSVMLYAAFCVLEEISFTRKDGQYLRWDARSGRTQGKTAFNKGTILTFCEAIQGKLKQVVADLIGQPLQIPLYDKPALNTVKYEPRIFSASSLDLLPTIPPQSIDFVLTSPPYANRYDYTRTYALELVYLGCDDEQVKRLRQMMLSCTVENKDKRNRLAAYYTELGRAEDFTYIDRTFDQQPALQEVISSLEAHRNEGSLNNPQIVRLIHNYFYEMAFVIYELARLLRPGGIIAMVNDNVRYAGEEVPVDLILSDMAETFGLSTQVIWTLGRGKGNSSQQMGSHGRSELRKCVYVWQKPNV